MDGSFEDPGEKQLLPSGEVCGKSNGPLRSAMSAGGISLRGNGVLRKNLPELPEWDIDRM